MLKDGMRLSEHLKVRASNLYIRPDIIEVLVRPVPPEYLPLYTFKIFKFRPTAQQLRDEPTNVYHKLGCAKLSTSSASPRNSGKMKCPAS